MDKQQIARKVLERLKKRYQLKTALTWKNAWELLVATVLAAQCTDERVNKVTPVFFEKWPDPSKLANAEIEEVEKVIRSTGFFRNKARNLVNTAKILIEKYNGQVPKTMEELVSLPGVARKTANIVLGNAFGIQEGIAVDTHVKRLAFRIGLTKNTTPNKVEQDLMKIFPKKEWSNVNHLLVYLGREVCKARKPNCEKCPLNDICEKNI
ncbi:DNA-(apurinic or apyrimidinic site) lyase /endonuclease III [Desulfonauticus submarinus]|uniref:Endonuclease III n=1 Tax=Desulfonauticus submarinus TaxID=206665 RepID=A0A1H0AG25_9BACT|nr:endonuclease III [Desulfonauticus submarinus]SDN32271.1 DNA-(apurinic or apyrimidinic site) lyase /endonuclease III [Desulfonauticus submarinus]